MECLVCGPTCSLPSKEHVFAAWLLKLLKAKDASMTFFRRAHDGSRVPYRNEMLIDSFRLPAICAACNNGWMSRLENRAKPLIESLICGGSTTLESLDNEQRQLLARWAGKTAIIETHAIGAESPVDGKLLRWMRTNEDGSPGRFAVVAAPNSCGGIGHLQVGIITDLLGGHSKTIAVNIVVLGFPNLILTCGFPWPEIDYECRCDLSFYRPLWPESVAWRAMSKPTPPLSPEEKELEMLEALAEKIEIFQRLR